MSIELETQPLAPRIANLLAALRLRIRGYVWTEGLATITAALGIAFWASLAFDWSFEPPWQFRAVILVAIAAGIFYIVDRFILKRAFRPLGDANLAILLERRFHDFHDSLLTTVELGSRPRNAADFNSEMFDRTRREAAQRSEHVRLADVFRYTPLIRALSLAAALSVSVLAFAVVAPEALAVWMNRVVLLDHHLLWPRANHIRVADFPANHIRKVAKGSDFEVIALADLTGRFRLPDSVQVRYHTEEGTRGRDNMSTVGAAGPQDSQQKYSYLFKGVMSSIDFDLYGGDDRDRDYRIEVVENPTISKMQLDCVYPTYTGRPPNTLPATGQMQLAAGTKITIRCETNKDMVEVPVTVVHQDQATPLTDIQLPPDGDRRHFSIELPELTEDTTLLLDLHDTDGIRSRDPVRLVLSARPDESPIVALRLHGISTAITADARLPAVGDVHDDYGLARLWFEYQLEGAKSAEAASAAKSPQADAPDPKQKPGAAAAADPALGQQPMQTSTSAPDGRPLTELKIDDQPAEALDLKRLVSLGDLFRRHGIKTPDDLAGLTSADERSLAAGITTQQQIDQILAFAPRLGDRLIVTMKAADNCGLAGGPNTGQSDRYQLDIIAPEQLLSMLEGRELMLRRQFEIIYQEMVDTRVGLARIDFTSPDIKKPTKNGASGAEPEDATAKQSDKIDSNRRPSRPLGAEPGDQPTGDTVDPDEMPEQRQQRLAQRALELRDVQVARGLDNGDRSAQETLTVAQSFDDIREEMVNNRVDTPELQTRLKDQIADPLKQISQVMFPDFRSRLTQLRRTLDDPQTGPKQLKSALDEADAILVEMKSVLDKMLELETFNEVVDTLRSIISEQDQLNQETLRRQKDELKNKLQDLK
ncbi:MAG TPA: hypothetical protein VGI75_13090 [Pirellulales bacterium]